jgi:DNA-binding transcriptional MerR regulator
MTSQQVATKAGVSLRQLQWWDEHGIVSPVKIGFKRFYTPEQLEQVIRLGALRKAGASLHQCRKLLKLQWKTAIPVKKGVVIGDILVVP